ncbi:MAG: glutamine--fructose-6-phosphate transaminase (isomerizing) [Clostridia bacterium]|nr:glutamine--fructose-6-phosphate transaminase (isomerizing) [Clostridia bacterium]
MCGIVGYVGRRPAAPILLDGLSKLEYRGYDSAGLAVWADGGINVQKTKGRLSNLYNATDGGKTPYGFMGIGHTRWATHGEPSDINSHPHTSQDGNFAVVHNGIIENYLPLRRKLEAKGFSFRSETDTEVISHLFEYYYSGNLIEATVKVMHRLEGSYALGVLCEDFPDRFVAVRKSSPLICADGEDESFIASDVTAILPYTRSVYYLNDGEIALVGTDGISFYNTDCEEIKKEHTFIEWDISAAEKGGYEHFMMKEIEEQPKAVADTVSPRIKDGKITLDGFNLTARELEKVGKIHIAACGSAYHAGIVGKYVIEQLCRISVEVDVASEFRYRNPIINEGDLVIVISQSGETADTLAALREAKARGAKTLAIVNVVGSTIALEADSILYTHAGPEIAVATTKAYSTQLALLYLLAADMAEKLGRISGERYSELVDEIEKLPEKIGEILKNKEYVQYLASKFYSSESIFFIGRNTDYAVSLEGSLKLKEISYIHSEAYAAGELKHGTISLIENGTPTVAVMTGKRLFAKTASNAEEVKSRGGIIVAVICESERSEASFCDHIIRIPDTDEVLAPSLAVIPLQLFSYYTASLKGLDIDKPRNLAKSVTVE